MAIKQAKSIFSSHIASWLDVRFSLQRRSERRRERAGVFTQYINPVFLHVYI